MSKGTGRISDILFSIYRYIVLGIFLFINIWLFLLSIFSTSRLTQDANEYTYYTRDYFWLHILILAALAAFIYFLVNRRILQHINAYYTRNKKAYIKARNTCLIIIGIIGAAWVLLTQSHAGADQYYVLKAAEGLRNGDYSAFQYDGYIAKYTNQIGLLFIEYLIGFIVGDYNYIFWQLLNVVMVVFTYKLFSDILALFNMPRLAYLLAPVSGILFFPWTLYSVFIYGNVAGLFFAALSFKYALLFIDSADEKCSVKHLLISGLAMMLSVMVKNNYLIFMIALIIYTVAEMLRRRNIQIILLSFAVIAGFCMQAVIPKLVIEKITGCDLNNGASSWAWIDMGLRPNAGTTYADGWYNGQIAALYENNGYDTKKEAVAAKEEIKAYLELYRNDSKALVSFLSKKVASQWNNPEFQCFWITNVRGTNIRQSSFITGILSVKDNSAHMNYLNILQSLILFGSLIYAIDAFFRKSFVGTTVLPLTFIGGFIFHIFWEGKCQYTLPYFMILIPLCIMGYNNMAKRITDTSKERLLKCGIWAAVFLFITIAFNRFIIIN